MDEALFEAALAWDDYLASMTANRQLLRGKLDAARLPRGEAAFWAGVGAPLRVLVLTEDWCQDSVTALPPLLAVARTAPRMKVRVLRRSQALELARALTRNEYPPIPILLFYDETFRELGRFVEKPAGWDELMDDPEQRAWLRGDPDMYDALWAELELAQMRGIVVGAAAERMWPVAGEPV